MILTDTHTHLYLGHFDNDRYEVVQNAINKGVHYMLIPNIDSKSVDGMLSLCDKFPENCFPMMGLHPTDVKDNFQEELAVVEQWLGKREFIAIGEIGIDLYWDKTFVKEQRTSFKHQIALAKQYKLPIVIHSRESMKEIFEVLEKAHTPELKGVFHCFSGTANDAKRAIEMGFYLGIGGVVTFKNSSLKEILSNIELENILIETDAPFLSPHPFRGKRNESAYIYYIAEKIAEIKDVGISEVADKTTHNAKNLFKF